MDISRTQSEGTENDPEKGSVSLAVKPLTSETMEPTSPTEPFNGLRQHMGTKLSPEEVKAEKSYLRKVDATILPMLAIMYFLASLDRGDFSNASVAGMKDELHLSDAQISQGISLFYVGHTIVSLPASMLLLFTTANIQLGFALITWGLFTTLMCLARNYGTLLAFRVLVGVCEGFLQAGPVYLIFWYKRNELATRGAIFYSMTAVAGSANGLLAYAIQQNMEGLNGWGSWRYIFLIEGLMSVVFGIFTLFFLPSRPDKNPVIFTKNELVIAKRRSLEAYNVDNPKLEKSQLLRVVKDIKVWLYVLIYFCDAVSVGCFGSYLPILLRNFNYSKIETQLLTIPVWVCCGIFILGFSITSDRLKRRGIFVLTCFGIATIGWIMFLASNSQALSFASVFVIGVGSLSMVVLIQAWQNNNLLGFTKRAFAFGISLVGGILGNLIGTSVFSDGPRYIRGGAFALAMMVLGFAATAAQIWHLRKLNRNKVELRDSDSALALRGKGIEEVSDDHPDFMYFL